MLPTIIDDQVLELDRYSYYADCRKHEPTQFVGDYDGYRSWAVFGFQDVKKLSMSPGSRVNPVGLTAPVWMHDELVLERRRANLAQTDNPLHGELRRSVSSFFSPRNVEAMREVSRQAVERLIAGINASSGAYDAVAEFAGQVPRDVICNILGIPLEDWNMLIAMQHDFLMIFSFTPLTEEQEKRLHDVTEFYIDYFRSSLESGKVDQSTSFVAHLLAEEKAGKLNRMQVLSFMHTVLDGGYETTRTTIANAIEIFANNPEIMIKLRCNKELINNAVEEIIRFRAPIHVRNRFLVNDYTTEYGHEIKAGDQVFMVLASACRDEARFENSDEIDILRPNAIDHVAFGGGGMHSCLGTALARLQIQEVFKGIVGNIEEFEIASLPARRHPSLIFPALAHLHVISTPMSAEKSEMHFSKA